MDNPTDDPRQFTHEEEDVPVTFLDLLSGLAPPRSPRDDAGSGSGDRTRRFSFQSGNGNISLSFGSGSGSRGAPPVPSLADFLAAGPAPERRREGGGEVPGIAGPLFAQYLMALLGGRAGPGLGDLGGMPGRMGDYVYNQEALDNIISQLMEQNNSHRPVPAPEDVMDKLPREVLEEGSPMLEKDCAVCKDQFTTNVEECEDQVVVTLPCKHAFHEQCIIPWLKSSGTCPVCRHQLVPQPDRHSPGSPPAGSGSPPGQDRGGGWRERVARAFGGRSPPQASGSGESSSQARDDDEREPRPPGSWD
ncbi:hypothetical protein HDZ31DRAFT_48451 [Schizophyllum fasciatum]